ncbi:MAG: hypothetical protein HYW62_00205 [Candidatus Levybacteria bacterium]|nr:hypothetical protein [Candidatus Levybacteria bacterium]
MDTLSLLNAKSLFRFTGPPEHWLTAVKYMTWGLEDKYKEGWARIRPGDIFLIHSTQNSYFKNAKSGIIGLGVVGPDFSIKKNLLWLYETSNNINKWPLLVPLSEIYLFSELPPVEKWENPSKQNLDPTKNLIDALIKNYIPLSQIKGFPQMGSFSGVSPDVARQILFDKRPLYLYTDHGVTQIIEKDTTDKKAEEINRKFDVVKNSKEAMRYADTLKIFESVKTRIIREPTSQYSRDNELLDRANTAHQTILQQLINLFRSHGYETFSSPFVDMFAHNENRSFLFEVKSTENSNFRTQARKGIAQLLEYEYFDVQKFAKDNELTFHEQHKLIIPSKQPKDVNYVTFINSLRIGVAMVESKNLKPVGTDFGFSKI